MSITNNFPKIAYFIPLVIVYLTVGQLQLLTPFISVALLYVIGIILLFILDKKITSYPFFTWCVCFSVVVLINNVTGDSYFSNIIQVLSTFFFIFFSCITSNYCIIDSRQKLAEQILRFFFIAVLYLTICSVILDINQPGVLRYATSLSYNGDDSLLKSLVLRGMSNYYLPHAIPMLIPPIVMGIKNRLLSKSLHLLLFLVLLVSLVLIFVSYATTPLLFAVLFLIISVFVKNGSLSKNIKVFLIVSLLFSPLIISQDIQLSLLGSIDSIIGGEGELHSKIEMFKESIKYGKATGDMEERLDLYNESLAIFNSNLVIGTNGMVGGHSFILDLFASLGLVGFVLFVMFVYKQVRYSLCFLPKFSHIYCYLSISAGILMFLTKSMSNWEMWLVFFCIVPLLTKRLSMSK